MRSTECLRNQSVSWGTLRREDLIPAFIDTLELFEHPRAVEFRKEGEHHLHNIATADYRDGLHDDAESFLWETLIDALDEIAPSGCYFGTTEGDGSDFGFWESLEECDA